MDIEWIVIALLVVVPGLLGVLVLYSMLRALFRYDDPDLIPGEVLSFRALGAITYDKLLGFANGHVFLTNQRVMWTPVSFPKPLGSRPIAIQLNSIREVSVRPREPHRGFAVPVRVSVPGHSYNFYIGFNTLDRGRAEVFAERLNGLIGEAAITHRELPAEEVQLPFQRARRLEYAMVPASILFSVAMLVIALRFDFLTPYLALVLIAGPFFTAGIVLYQELQLRSDRK